MDTALLVLRVIAGGALLAQGIGKLRRRNWPGAVGYFGGLGFEPAKLCAGAAAVGEAVAGASLLLGLLTPLGSAAALGVLIPAVWVNSANGWSATRGGIEYPVVLAGAAAALAFAGAGEASLDNAFGIDAAGTEWGLAAVGLAVAAALPLMSRRVAVLRRRAIAVRRSDFEAVA